MSTESFVTRTALARSLGLSPNTVATWIRQYGCPWPLSLDAIEWILRRKRPHVFVAADAEGQDLERELLAARLRTERERGSVMELDRRQKEGELIALAEVEERWSSTFVRIRQRLLAVAVRTAPLVVGEGREHAEAILDEEIRLALEELSQAEDANTDAPDAEA